MKPSKYNIFSAIKGSEEYFLINLLSGQADILDKETALKFKNGDPDLPPEFIEKGYLIDPLQEEHAYRLKYIEFLENRETEEIQLFFVPGYSCNFSCSYCYQDEYQYSGNQLTIEVIDAFFNYINNTFSGKKKYITLFGGEPFLNNPAHKNRMKYFFEKATQLNIDIAVVTNGFHIIEYKEIISFANIREIQVTLDGVGAIHDNRRFLKGGGATFDKISEGVNWLLSNDIPVNLRMVVDKENIMDLPNLADFAINNGWTKNRRFKTQLGRNYELHHCQESGSRLFSRIELYEELYNIISKYPRILEFHRPAFSIARFLFDEGELPAPLFDACPGTKTEWAFDYSGGIYSCTATVGKSDEILGKFYPEIFLDEEKVSVWESRDVLSISACRECSVQHICGGGCGSLAKNLNGHIHSPDCRPIKELLEMGVGFYMKN